MVEMSRRSMLGSVALAGGLGGFGLPRAMAIGGRVDAVEAFPAQDPALVREVVGASHSNLERVRELLGELPQLAGAAYDWGFGDWETALGAASHTGRREIAVLLIEHGARPDLFTHAMLGHEGVVRAALAAMPALARVRGPHDFSLAHHARAGGEAARGVVEFLASVPEADLPLTDVALGEGERAECAGVFAYGPGESQRLELFTRQDGLFMLRRVGGSPRRLRHLGDRVFSPAGAPGVRIDLVPKAGRVERMEIAGPRALGVGVRA